MLLKVNKIEFKSAVEIARRALSKIIIQEERSHILFSVVGNDLEVSATNNDFKAYYVIKDCEVDGSPVSFTADPVVLLKLLAKLDGDTIPIEVNEEDLVVKVYTSEGKKSFSSMQSFPADKMLEFKPIDIESCAKTEIPSETLSNILKWSINYLAEIKEESKGYDFLILNKKIAYAANGANKMGYLVSRCLEPFKNVKIRKVAIPLIISAIDSLGDEEVMVVEDDKNTGISSRNGNVFFGCLKSSVEPPKYSLDHLKSEGNHVEAKSTDMMKIIDRLVVTLKSYVGAGIQITLSGEGSTANLDFSLVSKLNNNERLSCSRVDDKSDEIAHVVDYKLFKKIMFSFDNSKPIKLFINDDTKFFKAYQAFEVNEEKFVSVGVGAYSRVVNS